jgi:GNAT superfamily N-acetyltransferase
MTAIRPLERDDVPQVAALYERVMRPGSPASVDRLAPYLERMLLDDPWADPALPALVYTVGDGRVAGFIGSYVRRLRFDGQVLRLRHAGCFVTDPPVRRRGAGTLLLRHFLAGPQDLTLADSATVTVAELWERLGGASSPLASLSWLRVFRPLAFAGPHVLRRVGQARLERPVRPVAALGDAVLGRLGCRRLAAPEPPTHAEDLTPASLLEHLPAFAAGRRFHPDYDEAFLGWLFAEMDAVRGRGPLVRRLVRAPAGDVLGWYLAYLPRGGQGDVMQLVAARATAERVVDHLLHEAWTCGTTALRGRLEPVLFEPTVGRGCLVRRSPRVLVHARDREVARAVLLGEGLLSRTDGEWWMGYVGGPAHLPAEAPDVGKGRRLRATSA